jgi:hypothetical protein
VIGWICFAYIAYKVTTVKIEIDVWDPYEVLGISEVNIFYVTLDNLEILCVLKQHNFYNFYRVLHYHKLKNISRNLAGNGNYFLRLMCQ